MPEAPAHRASVLAAVPAGAATLVVGRGGGIEPGLVACLPDADHNKMRAHGHASDLSERTPRDPSLHLTAPYAIPPLNWGNTLQSGAARGVASWPLPSDTEGVTGSNPVAPTRHNASTDPPVSAVCQQIVSRSLNVTARTL